MNRTEIIEKHKQNGVSFVDETNAYIDEEVTIGSGTVIEPNVCLKGKTAVGKNCVIGFGSQLTDAQIADGVNIAHSVITESFVDEGTNVGPFAYIRPNCRVGKHVKVGDFVELKNSNIGDGTKIAHLTYIGDADVGRNINFGCGTVIVNYDGQNKFRTVIEDDAFIGCNSNLVAPVTVGKGAFTAAGSTITDDVPEEALAIARARQVVKTGWKRPEKIKK